MKDIFSFEEKLPVTCVNKELKSQKHLVNAVIKRSMKNPYPFVKLKFLTCSEIQKEMKEIGWKHEKYINKYGEECSMYIPHEYDLYIDEKTDLITAMEFYEKTLVKQRKIITKNRLASFFDCNKSIKLHFDVYEILIEEMKEDGWEYKQETSQSGLAYAVFSHKSCLCINKSK